MKRNTSALTASQPVRRKFLRSAVNLLAFSSSPTETLERNFSSDKDLNEFIKKVIEPQLKKKHLDSLGKRRKFSAGLKELTDQPNDVLFLLIDQLIKLAIEKHQEYQCSFKSLIGPTKYIESTKDFIENIYQSENILKEITKKFHRWQTK